MPTTVRNKRDPIALVKSQYKEAVDKIEAQIVRRRDELLEELGGRDASNGIPGNVLLRRAAADPIIQDLGTQLAFHEAFRDAAIKDGFIPTIQDDGTITWILPKYDKLPPPAPLRPDN